MPPLTFGFVVPVLEKDAHFLDGCFRAVAAMEPRPECVVVVANGPGPYTDIHRAMEIWTWNLEFHDGKPVGTKVSYLEFSALNGCLPLPSAINAGVLSCPTEWVAMLSADDAPLPNYLRVLREHADGHDVVSMSGKGCLPDRTPTCGLPAQAPPQILGWSPFRKSLWERIGGFDETTPIFDGKFWIRCVQEGARIKVVQDQTFLFMDRPDSFAATHIFQNQKALWNDVLRSCGLPEKP